MRIESLGHESRCAYCGKSFQTEVKKSLFAVCVGEELDGRERSAVLQSVCVECAEEKELDKIMTSVIKDGTE